MKRFSCDGCQQPVFFESVQCTRCGQRLAYLPNHAVMSGLVPDDASKTPTSWRANAPITEGARYRLCQNDREYGVCNWSIPMDDPEPYCRACRLNKIIPNLSDPGAQAAWYRLETAKRRLLHTLITLELPVEGKDERPDGGLAFSFMKDVSREGGPKVFTGHKDGLVTIDIAETDDPAREKTRVELGEAYRTVLGHFRHEIGHYYWDQLVSGSQRLEPFRALFGDERADYAEAQQRHYTWGPPADWPHRFVSSYASMHPFEDWAETWAHYLHMTDTLETARAHGLAPARAQPPATSQVTGLDVGRSDPHAFNELLGAWVPVTIALNDLNRSMGLPDPYPFVLSDAAVAKLRFVHDVIQAWSGASA